MTCTISLSADGGLQLGLPSGRKLYLGTSTQALEYVHRILYDAQNIKEPPRGYIGQFPTQAEVDKWLAKARIEKRDKAFADLGIDVDELEINL